MPLTAEKAIKGHSGIQLGEQIIDRIVKVNGENEAVIGFCLQEVIDNAG